MKATFVVGTFDYEAVKKGMALNESSYNTLNMLADCAGINKVDVVVAVPDAYLAGRAKADIKIDIIRKHQEQVLEGLRTFAPDMVICFGPVAVASVFDNGSLVEDEILRKAHYPFGENLPVFGTFGLTNVHYNPGLMPLLKVDVQTAVKLAKGIMPEVEWGDYTILTPDMPEWDRCPYIYVHEEGRDVWFDEKYRSFKQIGFDLETYPGTNPWVEDARIRMAVLSTRVGSATIVQSTQSGQFPAWVKGIAEYPGILKVGSNIKFDYLWLRRFGITTVNMADTSTVEHIIDESNPKKDLKNLALKYVPKLGDYNRAHRKLVKERKGWENITDEEMFQYAGGDGEASIGVWLAQEQQLKDRKLDRPYGLMMQLYVVLCDMEHNGARICMDTNATLNTMYGDKMCALAGEIATTLGPINPNSPMQVGDALLKACPGIDLSRKDARKIMSADESEKICTKREVLELCVNEFPIVGLILEYRKYQKRHASFIKNIREKHATWHDKAWYIHPSFHTAVVDTHRLSSRAPNGQNIPRKDNDDPEMTIKKQYISRFKGGKILDADQSQIEIRAAALLSGDENMLAAIESGEDIHRAMASKMLFKKPEDVTDDERTACKTSTFRILYGGGAKGLSTALGITLKEAHKIMREYFAAFPRLREYIDEVHADVQENLSVVTDFGFTRRFVEPDAWKDKAGWRIMRQSFNTLVQNYAACVTYCAMIWLHKAMKDRKMQSKMILQVHDSIVLDTHPDELKVLIPLVKYAMETGAKEIASGFGVNIAILLQCDISIGDNWGEQEDVDG